MLCVDCFLPWVRSCNVMRATVEGVKAISNYLIFLLVFVSFSVPSLLHAFCLVWHSLNPGYVLSFLFCALFFMEAVSGGTRSFHRKCTKYQETFQLCCKGLLSLNPFFLPALRCGNLAWIFISISSQRSYSVTPSFPQLLNWRWCLGQQICIVTDLLFMLEPALERQNRRALSVHERHWCELNIRAWSSHSSISLAHRISKDLFLWWCVLGVCKDRSGGVAELSHSNRAQLIW